MNERLTQVTIVEKEAHKLLPGEATYSEMHHAWLVGCPSDNCGVGNLGNHTVTKDDMGITVSPSILCGCGAHYFIVNNEIRWC